MKSKRNFWIVLIVVAIGVLFANCKKDAPEDYRDDYVGSYKCKKTGSYWNNGDSVIHYYDTVEVVKIMKTGESFIMIHQQVVELTQGFTFDLKNSQTYSKFSGKFGNGTLQFSYRTTGSEATYTGQKM